MTHCKFWSWVRREATPKLREGVGLGVKTSPIEKCNIGFLLTPHKLDQSAISYRFCRTQQRYRQTELVYQYPDFMLRALTRLHRSVKTIHLPKGRHNVPNILRICHNKNHNFVECKIKHCVLMRCKQQPFLTGKIPILNCFAQINIVIDGQN
jgi:hypothetical protein